MPPRIPRQLCQQLLARTSGPHTIWAPFSVSTRTQADNPPKDDYLVDLLSRTTPSRPQQSPTPPRTRPSTLRSDSSNPFLPEIPPAAPLPRRNRPSGVAEFEWQDTGRPLRTDLKRPPLPASFRAESELGSSLTNALALNRIGPKSQKGINQEKERQARVTRIREVENQAARTWRSGDLYAPHDLSPAEMFKARQAKYGRSPNLPALNSRKKGGRDLIDDLGIDPLKEYKNFALMGEFMSDLGRIKHSRETGLRAVNQRRMAKAIRRAIGIGIMPSVHRHPELMEERAKIRQWGRK